MARLLFVGLVMAQILLVQAMAVRSYGSGLTKLAVVFRTGESELDTSSYHAVAKAPVGSELSEEGGKESEMARAPEIGRPRKHHSTDKSVAGGGVIIGGLVTAIFAAVYSYIRVTTRRDGGVH